MGRRDECRVNWSHTVQYRISNTRAYKTGLLMNLSNDGALLWLKEDFSVGCNLELLVGSNDRPEHVHMRVVRTEETNCEGYKGYGCRVEMRISET